MSIIASILLFVLFLVLLVVVVAWSFLRSLFSGFRAGRRGQQQSSQTRPPRDIDGDGVSDDLEDTAARRYYYNRTGKVDKERAEDVNFEEVAE